MIRGGVPADDAPVVEAAIDALGPSTSRNASSCCVHDAGLTPSASPAPAGGRDDPERRRSGARCGPWPPPPQLEGQHQPRALPSRLPRTLISVGSTRFRVPRRGSLRRANQEKDVAEGQEGVEVARFQMAVGFVTASNLRLPRSVKVAAACAGAADEEQLEVWPDGCSACSEHLVSPPGGRPGQALFLVEGGRTGGEGCEDADLTREGRRCRGMRDVFFSSIWRARPPPLLAFPARSWAERRSSPGRRSKTSDAPGRHRLDADGLQDDTDDDGGSLGGGTGALATDSCRAQPQMPLPGAGPGCGAEGACGWRTSP